MDDRKLDLVWQENPETIKKFLEQKTDYEQLCAEIAYILKKKLSKDSIEYSSVSFRAKTLKSFLIKIVRKTYENPFNEITDFAGVRVVFLYQNDLTRIEHIIKKEFEILKKVDKLNEKGIEKFGYGAIHYIVKIGKNSSGARYDDLKKLVCEIQVRTVLQDAWAIIDHHLVYKKESEIPTNLQRKLNSLAGLFETADNQFDILK
jgi:putative GTP pyrophosphokinase